MKEISLNLVLEDLECCEVLGEYTHGWLAGAGVCIVAGYAVGAIVFT